MEKDSVIEIKNVSKTFKIGVKRKQTTLARIISLLSYRESKRIIKVLDNISLRVKKGESIVFIGNNGSGKSTLLRIIAGIIKENTGKIETKGKIISLINLNSCMRDKLTVRDNVYLGCSFFEMGSSKIKNKFSRIIDFSELGSFVDTKWYQLSEGMKQRIAFSIAINSDPEILLLDEVFEVGDESFKLKCFNELNKLKKKGITIIFTSHRLKSLLRSKHKIIWLDHGKIIMEGQPSSVINTYLKNAKK